MLVCARFGLALAACCCGTSIGALQPDDRRGEIVSWARSNLRRAAEGAIPSPAHFVLRREFPPTVDDATLARWRAESAGKPEHPRVQDIRFEELKRSRGGISERVEFWRISNSRWRVCNDFDYRDGSRYTDSARDADGSWQLEERALILCDAASPSAVRQSHRNNAAQVESNLGFLYFAGFHLVALLERPVFSTQLRPPDRWMLIVSDPSFPSSWTWHGAFVAGDVRPDRLEVRAVASETPVMTIDFETPSTIEDDLAPRLNRATVSEPNLASKVVYSLLEVASVSPSAIEPLLAHPDPLGSDPLRGKLSVHRFDDHRAGVHRSQISGEKVFSPLPSPRSDHETARLRIVGWITLVALVVVFLFLRFRSGRALA